MEKELRNKIINTGLLLLMIASAIFAIVFQAISGFQGDTKTIILKNINSWSFWISWIIRFLILTSLWTLSNYYFKGKFEANSKFIQLHENYKKWNEIRQDDFDDFLKKKNLEIKISLYIEDVNQKIYKQQIKLAKANDTHKQKYVDKITKLKKLLDDKYIEENIEYIHIKRFNVLKKVYFTNDDVETTHKTKIKYINTYSGDTNIAMTKRIPKNLFTTLLSSVLAIVILSWSFSIISILYMLWLISMTVVSSGLKAYSLFNKNLQSPLRNKIEVLKDYCKYHYGFYTSDVEEALSKVTVEKNQTNKEKAYKLAEQISNGSIKLKEEDGKIIGVDKDNVQVFEKVKSQEVKIEDKA